MALTDQVADFAELGDGEDPCGVKLLCAKSNAVELRQGNAALGHLPRRPPRTPHVGGRELCGEEVRAGEAFQLPSGAALDYAHGRKT